MDSGLHVPRSLVAAFLCAMIWQSLAHASLTNDQMDAITTASIEMCRGGMRKGSESSIVVQGDANARAVLFKKLAEVGLNGKINFTESEWDGIKAVTPEQFDQKAYTQCISHIAPLLLSKVDPFDSDACEKTRSRRSELEEKRLEYRDLMDSTSGPQHERMKTRYEEVDRQLRKFEQDNSECF